MARPAAGRPDAAGTDAAGTDAVGADAVGADWALPDDGPSVLVVEVAARPYAFAVGQVKEVVRSRPLTPVPGAPLIARGLLNVRGVVVTVLDLARLLRDAEAAGRPVATDTPPAAVSDADEPGPARDAAGPGRRGRLGASVVLLEHRGRAVGVAVDAVHGVVPLEGDGTPDATGGAASRRTGSRHGARARAGGREVVHLDADALLAPVMLMAEDGR